MLSLTKSRNTEFTSEIRFRKDLSLIPNPDFWNWIGDVGDGFYLKNALHLYGRSDSYKFHDLQYRSAIINDLYGTITGRSGLASFGEDAFGNQLIYDHGGFHFLIIESGELELISESFTGFLQSVHQDLDYYSGYTLAKAWQLDHEPLSFEHRLTPKLPFILGGAFRTENLYKATWEYILRFNAHIAQQIKTLPDGTAINLDFTDSTA